MDKVARIATIVAVLVAIIGVFVNIPFGSTILVIAGLLAALDIAEDRRMAVLVATLVLLAVPAKLSMLPAGDIISPILANLSIAYMGASIMIILSALLNRLKP